MVETHGRTETEALARRARGHAPPARSSTRAPGSRRWTSTPCWRASPSSSLVDELAHTNAPGSRHPKRYLDVEELLNAGIDVYTTLNIQHVESLNDVVAQITRIRVRETVPDTILDRADDIEVIDLTPDDLIQRLKDGKVYVPEQAQRALDHYFSPGNLTALRELALRRTAQRVDAAAPHAYAGPRHRGTLGCGRAHPRLHQRGPAAALDWCATPSGSPTACTPPGPCFTWKAGAAFSSPKRSATASPTPCVSPSGSGPRR